MVGQGGFSIVCKIENIELNEVFDTGEEESKARSDFAASIRENNYVMKTLRVDLPEEEYVKGIVDLAIEADFLAILSHPNVISMRAMANSDPHESRFFVVLDRLVTTLDRKFNIWRKEVGENSGFWFGPFGYCCSKVQFLYKTWLERISAARDIANAVYYLHSHSIVYRDLKPDNLGFDANGILKLFDFGLAKRLDPMDKTQDGLYMLTGNTGSLRYMAPEVARGEPYDQRVDTYSFGILFWQICSLQTPYAGFSTNMHAEKVVQQGFRPQAETSWPVSWTDMMNRAWNQRMTERPDFDEIAVFLDDQVDELRNNDGEVPTRASEIKAKMRKKQSGAQRLDVDTRISTSEDKTSKRFDKDIV
jgi:serine/threonine protein kinase